MRNRGLCPWVEAFGVQGGFPVRDSWRLRGFGYVVKNGRKVGMRCSTSLTLNPT